MVCGSFKTRSTSSELDSKSHALAHSSVHLKSYEPHIWLSDVSFKTGSEDKGYKTSA